MAGKDLGIGDQMYKKPDGIDQATWNRLAPQFQRLLSAGSSSSQPELPEYVHDTLRAFLSSGQSSYDAKLKSLEKRLAKLEDFEKAFCNGCEQLNKAVKAVHASFIQGIEADRIRSLPS